MTEPADDDIVLRPIGYVRNRVKEPIHEGWEDIESDLELLPELTEALDGLEEYSHIIVLFWLHRIPEERRGVQKKLHPRDRQDLPLVGIFATRTQMRPNPIAQTVVRLRRRRQNVLRVRGLDAIDGSPILDIKPYLPPYDQPEAVRLPEWVRQN